MFKIELGINGFWELKNQKNQTLYMMHDDQLPNNRTEIERELVERYYIYMEEND